jgi:hypothetical protein
MSDTLKAHVEGIQEIERKLQDLVRKYPEAAATATYQEGLALLADSVKEVPVDTGRLRRTGYVDAPTDARDPKVVVGYGTDYALPVHERTEVHHPVGKAKFLIDPMLLRSSGYRDRMIQRIAKNVRDGVTLGDVASSAGGGGGDE